MGGEWRVTAATTARLSSASVRGKAGRDGAGTYQLDNSPSTCWTLARGHTPPHRQQCAGPNANSSELRERGRLRPATFLARFSTGSRAAPSEAALDGRRPLQWTRASMREMQVSRAILQVHASQVEDAHRRPGRPAHHASSRCSAARSVGPSGDAGQGAEHRLHLRHQEFEGCPPGGPDRDDDLRCLRAPGGDRLDRLRLFSSTSDPRVRRRQPAQLPRIEPFGPPTLATRPTRSAGSMAGRFGRRERPRRGPGRTRARSGSAPGWRSAAQGRGLADSKKQQMHANLLNFFGQFGHLYSPDLYMEAAPS